MADKSKLAVARSGTYEMRRVGVVWALGRAYIKMSKRMAVAIARPKLIIVPTTFITPRA